MGKELLLKTLRHENTERAAWVPFAGVHAGKLKGYNAKELLTDSDKLYDSLMEVHRFYQPDGMPIVFDLQIEAEILGCELMWADYNPPSVHSHPLAGDPPVVPCESKIPKATDGRLPIVLNTMRRIKASIGNDTALYGLICGPLTLASHLRGTEFFMDMIENENYTRSLLGFCARVGCAMIDYYLDAGMDVIAVVDPLVSQVSPVHFKNFLSDPFTAMFDYIRSKGAYSSFFVCGNASDQIEVMCMTGPDGISVDENVNLPAAKAITDRYNIAIGGNIPLTTTMLFGSQESNMKCVVEELDSVDSHNLIVSPGCDMPYDIPVENAIAAAQAVLATDQVRQMIANYEAPEDPYIEVDIPEYDRMDKVLVELFLLDPDQCAACTYMLHSVEDAFHDTENLSDIAEYRSYRYCIREDIARTKKMNIRQLPSMCIDGKVKFSSIIPSRQELLNAIYAAYEKKRQSGR